MVTSELAYSSRFGEFEIYHLVREISHNYRLFEVAAKDSQAEQLRIFQKLESGLNMLDGSSFSSQVHFQHAHQTPVQRWFPYREGYSVKLVDTFIKELGITGNVFDPFVGSGTTLLASRMNDLNSFGIDVNPISVLVSQVENEQYARADVVAIEEGIKRLQTIVRSDKIYQTSFELADRVFNEEILQALLQFREHIVGLQNNKVRDLFFVAWLAIIEDVSNIKKEGNGIKYKNRRRTPTGYIDIEKEDWEKGAFPSDKFAFIKRNLLTRLGMITTDVHSQYGKCEKKPAVFRSSCLEFDKHFDDEIQFTFFSPPYCNCFDYFEIHKVEIWLGGFVSSKEEFRSLRNSGFRSNTNALNHKPVAYRNAHLDKTIALFDPEKLWNEKIPLVVRGYFDDMHMLLAKLYQRTPQSGFVGIVVGNSAYTGVIIPTDILVADIAQEVGFKVRNVFVTRHLTTSSQQKQHLEFLRDYLRESIVLLEK